MPSENPYSKPRTKKSDSHSSKPNTTGYRDDEEYPRGEKNLTRRQANLFPFMRATMSKGLTQHRRKKSDGGRRGRKTRRHTRRR
jgi:hypothetical protein